MLEDENIIGENIRLNAYNQLKEQLIKAINETDKNIEISNKNLRLYKSDKERNKRE